MGNINVTGHAKEKLDSLKKHENRTASNMVETLIIRAYNALKSAGK